MVIDRTGFTGTFNFKLDFAGDDAIGNGPGPTVAGDPAKAATPALLGPSIFAALQEELGLRLQSAKGPVEVLVIDRVERPSAN